jgi:transposase InsO family protein
MADEDTRRSLFVAIDRATRWVYVALKADKSARSAKAFLNALHQACPINITRLLTDTGKKFTDRLCGRHQRDASGAHACDQLCAAFGIEQRLTGIRKPQTNGMVERFTGRISDILKTHHFQSRLDLEQTLCRYVSLYNHHLPQAALNATPPIQAMKQWHDKHPELFHRKPYNRPGRDT